MKLRIEIPELPVSINAAFANFRGRRILTREYKAWLRFVEGFIPDGIPDMRGTLLSVEIDFHAPNWITQKGTPRKADVDNYAKTCLDAIFVHLPIDDSQIFTLKLRKVAGEHTKTVVRFYDLTSS